MATAPAQIKNDSIANFFINIFSLFHILFTQVSLYTKKIFKSRYFEYKNYYFQIKNIKYLIILTLNINYNII